MKFFTLLAGLFLAAVLTSAASLFEGSVRFEVQEENGPKVEVHFHQRGSQCRVNASGGGPEENGAMILNLETSEILVLVDQAQAYLRIPFSEIAKLKGQVDPEPAPKFSVKETGRTEKILGYPAKELEITDEDSTTSLWVTEALGAFLSGEQGEKLRKLTNNLDRDAWEVYLATLDSVFPLRVETREDGKVISTMRALSISKDIPAESLFSIPPGYQEMSMPMGMPR